MADERVRIDCTHCGVTLKAKPKVLGKTVNCPKCKKNFRAIAETDAKLTPEYASDQLLAKDYESDNSRPEPEAGSRGEMPVNFDVDLTELNFGDLDVPDPKKQ